MMYEEEHFSATNFFRDIMTPDDVLHVEILLKKIRRANPAARRYFERRCRNARELEEFFKDHDYLFYMQNRRVALHDDQLAEDCEMSVNYFVQTLHHYGRPFNYMRLKLEHMERADPRVCYFMSRFYPANEIKKFFKQRPNVFVLHKDRTVSLVEVDSVKFYRRKLQAGERQTFTSFRGHIGQAPPHVQLYINRNFLGDEFQDFLIRNSDVFRLDDDGFVSLVPAN